MPGRLIPLITGETYHVINRGVADQTTFTNHRDYQRALETIFFYQHPNPPMRYSYLLRLSSKQKNQILDSLKKSEKFSVNIIAYCLMPNHIHLLLTQNQEKGISTFMAQFTNSYTRYFNTKKKRIGHLFQGKFKAVRITTEEQLVHVSRYIHLNPYTAYITKTFQQLKTYLHSSFAEYIGLSKTDLCQKHLVMNYFLNKESYQKFVLDQSEYQRELGKIKTLLLE